MSHFDNNTDTRIFTPGEDAPSKKKINDVENDADLTVFYLLPAGTVVLATTEFKPMVFASVSTLHGLYTAVLDDEVDGLMIEDPQLLALCINNVQSAGFRLLLIADYPGAQYAGDFVLATSGLAQITYAQLAASLVTDAIEQRTRLQHKDSKDTHANGARSRGLGKPAERVTEVPESIELDMPEV